MSQSSLATQNSTGLVPASQATTLAPKAAKFVDSHLKFNLGLQTPALIATRHVQEAITVPSARVAPMPNMPAAMLGLINRRSRVLWVTDLALLMGLPVAYPNSQQYKLVLLQVNRVLLGLRVHEIEGIVSAPPEQIQPAPAHVPHTLLPFLRGCILQTNEVQLVLDAEAILQSPSLR